MHYRSIIYFEKYHIIPHILFCHQFVHFLYHFQAADQTKRLLEQEIRDLKSRITHQQMELDSLKQQARQRESGNYTYYDVLNKDVCYCV